MPSIFNSSLTLDEVISKLKDVKSTVHFLGILGSGCYPLAKLLRRRGYTVSGTDAGAERDLYVDADGIEIARFRSGIPHGTALLVYSLAISEDDPEILSARKRGVTTVSRAQLLGALMSEYPTRISVSGSHGKSTTTALIEHILAVAEISHTAVSGATLASGQAYKDERGDIFVAEACEYKDSFLQLHPTLQLITSVELDHTDYFPTLADISASFMSAAKMANIALINTDDTAARSIIDELRTQRNGIKVPTPHTRVAITEEKTLVTYGKGPDADYRLHSVKIRGELTELSVSIGDRCIDLMTPLIGEYNLYNVTAAVAVADMLGVDFERIRHAVSGFRGIARRASLVAHVGGAPVYYDYAHHPSELTAVISALKARYGTLTVIFRPHTYSRTQSLFDGFVKALTLADHAVLLDVYAAREKPIDGVDSKRLAKSIDNALYCADASTAASLAVSYGSGAIALLGAGEVNTVLSDLIQLGNNEN